MTVKPPKRSPKADASTHDASGASAFTLEYAATVLAPLSKDEAAAAVELALAAVLAGESARRDRITVFAPTLRIEKPKRRNDPPSRLIWVRLRDRDRGVTHDISVADGAVVEHVADDRAEPPVSEQEREEARRLIAGDAKLGKIAEQPDIEIEWFIPMAHRARRSLGARLVRVQEHRVVERVAGAEIDLDRGVLIEGQATQ